MNTNFLIVYFTEDTKPIVRVLSETTLGPEIEMNKIDYFKKNFPTLVKDTLHFHTFQPIATGSDPLIFENISASGLFCVASGISARMLFKEMENNPEKIGWLYKRQFDSIIYAAMQQKQHCNIH